MKQEITISHLVVNGCSFTYCDGLENPAIQGWPALLAKKLNVPVVNLAIGGTGNYRIYRKTVDYFFKDTGSNPFYIIGMTSCTRIEQYSRLLSDYVALNLIGDPSTGLWETQFIKLSQRGNDPMVLAKTKLDIWLSIINLFKSAGVNYLMADMICNGHLIDNELEELHPRLFDYTINDPNHVKGYLNFTRPLGKLPCGHDDAATQVMIAEYFYKEITNRYTVITENTEYLTVKDFYTEPEVRQAQGRKNGHWII
jgi:hypothetical protein